jgi:hypothetical protein
MYRILAERSELRERRDHQARVQHAVPRLVATAPNEVWTWDISKLATFTSGVFLNLYVILDLFSRHVVAWMVAERENSALAKQLFAEAISRYGIEPGSLLVHQDRGAPMTAHGFAELLSTLGVDRSYSRPRVSNDNPHQESLFHTVKYQPDYPGRFRGARPARHWCHDFFGWYNDDHHHDGSTSSRPPMCSSVASMSSQLAGVKRSRPHLPSTLSASSPASRPSRSLPSASSSTPSTRTKNPSPLTASHGSGRGAGWFDTQKHKRAHRHVRYHGAEAVFALDGTAAPTASRASSAPS